MAHTAQQRSTVDIAQHSFSISLQQSPLSSQQCVIVTQRMLAHYDRSAIEQAKDALWNHPDTISIFGKKVDRRDSSARTAEEANAEDITMACVKISKQESQLPLIAASATDILQMPPFEGAPEGGTQFRISCLEKDMCRMVNEFKTLSEELQSMKCRLRAQNETFPTCAEVLLRRRPNQTAEAVANSNRNSGSAAAPQETGSQGADSAAPSSATTSEATPRPPVYEGEEEQLGSGSKFQHMFCVNGVKRNVGNGRRRLSLVLVRLLILD